MSREYLKQRGKTWYVRIPVPLKAQKAVGAKEIVRTLQTDSLSEAKVKRHQAIIDIYSEINSAIHEQKHQKGSVHWLKGRLRHLMREHEQGEIDDEQFEALQVELLEWHQSARNGEEHSASELKVINNAYEMVRGKLMLSDAIDQYNKTIEGKLTDKTVASKKRTLNMFLDWMGDVPVQQIKRSNIAAFMDEVLNVGGRDIQTVTKFLSETGSLWTSYLIPRGHVESNPVSGMSKSLTVSKKGKKAKRRPWLAKELKKFLTEIRKHPKHHDLELVLLLTLYTGLRRAELVHVKVEDVRDGGIEITEGKSEAALRTVPIHPILKPLVSHLVSTSKDGYLLPTQRVSKRFEDALGKRFGRVRKDLGVDSEEINIHTLRHSFVSGCENAQIPEHLAKVLTGHSRGSITYGHYSPSNAVNWNVLTEAIERVSFGSEIDRLSRNAIARL